MICMCLCMCGSVKRLFRYTHECTNVSDVLGEWTENTAAFSTCNMLNTDTGCCFI